LVMKTIELGCFDAR